MSVKRPEWGRRARPWGLSQGCAELGSDVADSDQLDLVTVFATGNPVLIATAKLALEASGIRFLTKGEGIQDLIGLGRLFGGFNLATGPVQIQVERRDAAQAVEALRDIGPVGQEALAGRPMQSIALGAALLLLFAIAGAAARWHMGNLLSVIVLGLDDMR